MDNDTAATTRALAAPFDAAEVKFKPQAVKGNKALAMPYVTARTVMDRLDSVLSATGWADDYQLLPDGSAVCRLSCKLGGAWVTKVDVGSPSEQPDEGDKVKAAFSDALKRAAVKFGVGRYLYKQPALWADYDPARKQFVRPPQLPGAPARKPAPANPLPRDGAELLARLEKTEAGLVAENRCGAGELLDYLKTAGAKAGHTAEVGEWGPDAIRWCVEAVRLFVKAHPVRGGAHDGPALPAAR